MPGKKLKIKQCDAKQEELFGEEKAEYDNRFISTSTLIEQKANYKPLSSKFKIEDTSDAEKRKSKEFFGNPYYPQHIAKRSKILSASLDWASSSFQEVPRTKEG